MEKMPSQKANISFKGATGRDQKTDELGDRKLLNFELVEPTTQGLNPIPIAPRRGLREVEEI
jgi:hypothetical protein